jgi:hypothetical protein
MVTCRLCGSLDPSRNLRASHDCARDHLRLGALVSNATYLTVHGDVAASVEDVADHHPIDLRRAAHLNHEVSRDLPIEGDVAPLATVGVPAT